MGGSVDGTDARSIGAFLVSFSSCSSLAHFFGLHSHRMEFLGRGVTKSVYQWSTKTDKKNAVWWWWWLWRRGCG